MTEHESRLGSGGQAPFQRKRIIGTFDHPGNGSGGRSRLLSGLVVLLFLWGVTWPLFLRLRVLPGASWTHPEVLLSGAFALAVLFVGLLNRRGHYLSAATLAVVLLLSGVFASLNLTLSGAMEPVFSRNDPGLLSYIVLPVVLGAVLLPPRLLVAVTVCSLGAILSVPLLYPHVGWDVVLYGPLLYLVVVCGLLTFVSVLLAREQRLSLAALGEKEERYRNLFEQSPDANFLVAPDGVIRAVNEAGLALFGYSQDEVQGQHMRRLYANPGDREVIMAKTGERGYLYEEPVRLRRRDGGVLECLVTIRVRRDAAGRALEYQTIVRDVTARIRSDEEVKLKGQLLDLANDAIFLVDPGGEVVFANQATADLTGYTVDELLRMNVRQLNTREGAEQVPERISAMLREGGLAFSTVYVRKDGGLVNVDVRTRTIQSHGRTLFLSVCRDVTTLRKDEHELRLRGQLLDWANDAVLLHDLKGRLLYVNEAAAVQRGYTRAELLCLTLRDLDASEAAERFAERMAYLMNHRVLTFEGEHRRKDGSIMPVEVRARLVESGDQSVVLSVVRDISERKKSEAALKAERDRAQGYLDVAAVMLVVMDVDGSIALLNRRGAQILGADVKDLIGKSWIDTCVPEEQRDYVRSVFADFMAGRAELHEYVVNDILTVSGERRTVAWHNALLRDASGKPAGTLSSGEDITERLATERALRESEERFRNIMASMQDIVFTLDTEGRHTGVYGPWVEKSGLTSEFFLAKTARDIFGEEASRVHREANARALRGEFVVYDWSAETGGQVSHYQTSLSPIRDADGVVRGLVGVGRDVTDRRRAELKLSESEEKFRLLFERSLDAIYINTPEGKSIEANQAWLDMFGYSRQELAAVHSVDMYADPKDREDFLRQIEREGFVVGEARFRRKDGTPFDVQRSVVALRDESGEMARFVGTMRDITEQKRAEQALRESEAKYRALFEQSLDAVAVYSVDGTLLDANGAHLRLLGLTRDDIGKRGVLRHYVKQADRDEFLRLLDRDGAVVDQEVRLRRADGTEMDCVRSAVAWRGADGRLVAAQTVTRDITEERRRKTALADELTRRRILVEQSRDGIVVLDQDGKAVETNLRFAEMLGYSPEDVLQLHVWDWDVPTPKDRLNEMIRTVDESSDHFETRHRRKDGTIYDVEISTNAAVFGGQKLIFCVCRDITKRKQAEEALRESELRFRALVEHTGLGFTVTRTDGTFIDANDVFLQMTGYTMEELLRLRVPDVYASLDDRERVLAKGIRDGYVRGEELEFRRKDGSPLYVSLTSALVPLGGETVVISEFLDITERRTVDEELRRSREELRLLAARLEEAREEERTGIARELHDQLSQALTALKLDLDGVRRAVEHKETVPATKLDGMMKLLDDTSNDVRRISSELRPGILDDVGLVAAIEWELDQFGERTGIACRLMAGADDAVLDRACSTALFRVFQELLTNVARHAKARNVFVELETTDDRYVLTVTDDGVGITSAQIASVSSLGLIGMRERVRPFGGSVELSGAPGKGTVARVILPLS